MEKQDQQLKWQEYLTKLALVAVFLGGFVLVAWIGQRIAAGEFRPGALDLVLLGLATFRLGRLVAYDVVMEPLRRPVAHTVLDETGAGENVEARGAGARYALGQLVSCPICAGTWIAAGLTYGLYLIPGPTRLFLMAAAAIGLAELVNSLVESMCWSAQLSRTRTGKHLRTLRREQAARQDPPFPVDRSDYLWDQSFIEHSKRDRK